MSRPQAVAPVGPRPTPENRRCYGFAMPCVARNVVRVCAELHLGQNHRGRGAGSGRALLASFWGGLERYAS